MMNFGITTWSELGSCEGNILLIVNSGQEDRDSVALVLDHLKLVTGPAALHVIAERSWGPWLGERGLPEACVRLSIDDEGRPLEINHFLESPAGVLWTVPRQFRVIVGSAPHSLYNEEIKEIFEQRVCLLIGDGRFITHALPLPYLGILDVAAFLRRFSRRQKTEAYLARCRSFVQDCHAVWVERGSPALSDTGPMSEVLKLVGKHFGSQILLFDEGAPTPPGQMDDDTAVEKLALYYRSVLHAHDRALTELYRERVQAVRHQEETVVAVQTERTQAVATRDDLLAALQVERNEAVSVRDAIIADLRGEIEFLTRGWRRWVVKRR
jgi:hypothetical protein